MLSTLALVAALAAQSGGPSPSDTLAPADLFRPSPVGVSLLAPMVPLAPVWAETAATGPGDEPQLVEYSDAYFTRLTIHKWASYLTLPLFVGEYVVGQKLMNGTGSNNTRSVHRTLAAGIAGLFAVNTITGGLNAIEARKDPEGKNRRTIHSVLMLLADAGFVATGALAKGHEDEYGYYSGPTNNNAHRNMAIASMATALVSYAIMLPPFRRD
jgi:hypothetical protein